MDVRQTDLRTDGLDVVGGLIILLVINVALFIYIGYTVWRWFKDARLVQRALRIKV